MRAVVTEALGTPPVLRDVPEPEPGPCELLVRVRASSLNAFDLGIAAGLAKCMMARPFPVVLGRDFAGTVVGLGEGAQRFALGDPVFGVVAKGVLADGSFAELVTVPEADGVARLPGGVDGVLAGALGVSGLGALASVAAIDPRAGAIVLISGASGGVGSFAVQLAAGHGLHVIATARRGAAADLVRELGACDVVDHVIGAGLPVRALHVGGVNAVLHFAGDADVLGDLIRPGGHFASTLGIGQSRFAGRNLTAVAVMAEPTEEALSELATLVDRDLLRVPITRVHTLDEVPRALSEFPGTPGKSAVVIG